MIGLLFFYVYVYYDWNRIPRYVGKGKGRRYLKHKSMCEKKGKKSPCPRFHAWLRYQLKHKIEYTVELVAQNLTEKAAFQLEKKLIAKYGLIEDGGTLKNLTYGGEGPVPGPKTRKRLSKAQKLVMARPGARRKLSKSVKAALARPEVKKHIADAFADPVIKQRRKESANRPATKRRKSKSLIANWAKMTPKARKRRLRNHKLSLARPKTRQKSSKARQAMWADADKRQRMIEARWHQKPIRGEYKGVYSNRGKFLARIDSENLGTYQTAEEAARAYDSGVNKYHRGIGYKNFPRKRKYA